MSGGSKPGERRANAGRKKGIPNKRTLAQIAEAEAGGAMPLPALLQVMRYNLSEVDRILRQKRPNRKLLREALEYVRIAAKDAAPFLHATIKAQIAIPLGDAAGLAEFSQAKATVERILDRIAATRSIPGPQGTTH